MAPHVTKKSCRYSDSSLQEKGREERSSVFSVGKLEVVHRQLKCLTVSNLKHTGIVENGKRGYWKVSTRKLVSPPVVLQEVEVWMESWWARGI